MMNSVDLKIVDLFNRLVPRKGKADTVAGEIIRAICYIDYRFFNDGDQVGVGEGNATCNPAARYLQLNTEEDVARAIKDLWGERDPVRYKMLLQTTKETVLNYVLEHRELMTAPNTTDMWECRELPEDDADAEGEDEEDKYYQAMDDEDDDIALFDDEDGSTGREGDEQ